MNAKEHILHALRASGPLTESELRGELYEQCPGVSLENVVSTANEALEELLSSGEVMRYDDVVPVAYEIVYDKAIGVAVSPDRPSEICGSHDSDRFGQR